MLIASHTEVKGLTMLRINNGLVVKYLDNRFDLLLRLHHVRCC